MSAVLALMQRRDMEIFVHWCLTPAAFKNGKLSYGMMFLTSFKRSVCIYAITEPANCEEFVRLW
jgi:hypothetical protein